jgi:hypothetical protein
MENTYPDKLATPPEIRIPVIVDGMQDHGLHLVHEIGGKPRNYLHEVSIPHGHQEAVGYLEAAGYNKARGWVKDGIQHWVWSKTYPLVVAKWAEPTPPPSCPETDLSFLPEGGEGLDRRSKRTSYNGPDELAHVYSFFLTVEDADQGARDANELGITRKGKFVAGSFRVADIPGRMPAVVGDLTGN